MTTQKLLEAACAAQHQLTRAMAELADHLGLTTATQLDMLDDEVQWRTAQGLDGLDVASLRRALYLPPEAP